MPEFPKLLNRLHRAAPVAPASVLPGDAPTLSWALDAYLEQLCAPLAGLAPEEWQRDLRAELTSHLEALIEAHEELGASREDAVRHAFRQMDDPTRLGKQWARRWKARQPQASLWDTVRLTLACFGRATCFSVVVLLASMHPALYRDWGDAARILGVLLVPVAAGVVTGLRCRGHRIVGPLLGLLLLSACSGLFSLLTPRSEPADFWFYLPQIHLLFWLPLGWLSTVLTCWVCDWRACWSHSDRPAAA